VFPFLLSRGKKPQLETLLSAESRPFTWYQCRNLWSRKLNAITARSSLACFSEALRDVEASILVEFQSRWWIENRRRRWLEHINNVQDRRDGDVGGDDTCGDLYWLYAMLAMLLELESSIEEGAFQSDQRERRRWRRECEYLEEAVRESIGLEAAPHRILMGREREQVRSATFDRGNGVTDEDEPNAALASENNFLSSGDEDEEDEEEEEEGERMRRLRRQHHSIAISANSERSSEDRSGLHPVSFRVERRESVPLRVVEVEEHEADEAEELFSNRLHQTVVGRRSSVDYSRDPPRTRHVAENTNIDATPSTFTRPTDILETVYSSFDADINARSLREANMRIARAAREGLDASAYLSRIISHLASQQTSTTTTTQTESRTSVHSTSTNTPSNRGYRPMSRSRRTDEDDDEEESDEHPQHLKNEIARLRDHIEKLEKASTCVICYSNPRACALLPCCHFITCLECANRSRERFVEQTHDDDDDDDFDVRRPVNRQMKKDEVFFRCPTCRGNVTGVLQVFPP